MRGASVKYCICKPGSKKAHAPNINGVSNGKGHESSYFVRAESCEKGDEEKGDEDKGNKDKGDKDKGDEDKGDKDKNCHDNGGTGKNKGSQGKK